MASYLTAHVLWILGMALGATSQPASAPAPSPEQIARLVAQLDSDRYAQRMQAQNELMRLGEACSPALEAALAAGQLGAEGKTRAQWILGQVNVPQQGAVWRDWPEAKGPEIIQAGDVVTAVGREAVRNVPDLMRAVRQNTDPVLTVWRKGKGPFQVEGVPLQRFIWGFNNWPDYTELYTRYGTRGKGDDAVRDGLVLYKAGKPQAADSFRQAWDAGCRDALAATVWLRQLRDAGDIAEARKVWADAIAGKVAGQYPGGLWLYGMLPYERIHLELAEGHLREALAMLDQAAQEAEKADAWQGLACIRYTQMECKQFFDPPAEALKFWQAHADEIRLMSGKTPEGLMALMAGRLAGEGDYAAALAFLEKEPASWTRAGLQQEYERLARLAKGTYQPPRAHPVLVKVLNNWGPVSAPLNLYFRTTDLGTFALPARLECRVRMKSFPAERNAWAKIVTIHMAGTRHGLVLRLDHRGRCLYKDNVFPDELNSIDAPVLNPKDWASVVLEVWPHQAKAWVNGRPYRITYFDEPVDEPAQPMLSCSGCEAEFKDIRFYAGSTVAADNAKILEALGQFQQAKAAKDWQRAAAARKTLGEELDKVEPAKKLLGELDRDLNALGATTQPSK